MPIEQYSFWWQSTVCGWCTIHECHDWYVSSHFWFCSVTHFSSQTKGGEVLNGHLHFQMGRVYHMDAWCDEDHSVTWSSVEWCLLPLHNEDSNNVPWWDPNPNHHRPCRNMTMILAVVMIIVKAIIIVIMALYFPKSLSLMAVNYYFFRRICLRFKVGGDNCGSIPLWTPHWDRTYEVTSSYESVGNVAVDRIQWIPLMQPSFVPLTMVDLSPFMVFGSRLIHGTTLAHRSKADGNTAHCNCLVTNLLATGGDDGSLRVCDLS